LNKSISPSPKINLKPVKVAVNKPKETAVKLEKPVTAAPVDGAPAIIK
jgi:hypothetical protein